MGTMPKVSVIMPVYNGERYLCEAIDSVLAQTFGDFELLIINDGSTDRSMEVVDGYNDSRMQLIQNSEGKGVVGARNTGIAHAVGDYIAMMDCDDVSFPTRLEEQVGFLDRNPDFGMVGAWAEAIDEDSRSIGTLMEYNAPPEAIPSLLLFNNYFIQSAVLIRKSALPEGNYLIYLAEDYDLWVRIAERSRVWNLQEVLLKYRVHASSTSFRNSTDMKNCVNEILSNQLALIDIKPTESELDIHRRIGNMSFEPSCHFLAESDAWLQKLYSANERSGYYDSAFFGKVLAERWTYICTGSSELGSIVWREYCQSPCSKLGVLDTASKVYLFISTTFGLSAKGRNVIRRCGEKILQTIS